MGGDVAAEFLRLACLNYVDDDPERPARARALLAEQPAIARSSPWAAAAAGDPEALEALAVLSPTAATATGGSNGWEPLHYLCYSLSLGADPALHDREYRATPAGWAGRNGHVALAERLAALEAR